MMILALFPLVFIDVNAVNFVLIALLTAQTPLLPYQILLLMPWLQIVCENQLAKANGLCGGVRLLAEVLEWPLQLLSSMVMELMKDFLIDLNNVVCSYPSYFF